MHVRRNASRRSRGSPSRRRVVIEQERYYEWGKDKGYGYRWLVESAVSSIKRTMGEHISSKKTGQNNRRSIMENTTIQQIHRAPTKNKHLKTYKEGRNQELSNIAI